MLRPLRAKRTPREGAGQQPTLLLDQGQLPRENSLSTAPSREKGGESDACEIRPPTDADSTIGTIHDCVGRGGDDVGHVAHYGSASGNPLKRQ